MSDVDSYDGWESDSDAAPAQCLLCATALPGPEALRHMAASHGLDLSAVMRHRATVGGDGDATYDVVRLVNFARASTAAGQAPDAVLAAVKDRAAAFWSEEKYLRPVLPDDALLHVVLSMAFDEDGDSDDDGGADGDAVPALAGAGIAAGAGAGAGAVTGAAAGTLPVTGVGSVAASPQLQKDNEALKATVAALKQQLAAATATLRGVTAEDDDDVVPATTSDDGAGASAGAGAAASDAPAAPGMADNRNGYFQGYTHLGIHEEMLKDTVRTTSYMRAIRDNPHLFKDKVVLDVGCGTGILSMFAASAGARMVIGVDASGMLPLAREVIAENGLQDRVQLIQGKIEEVTLPVSTVDIIVSEWMGYFLVYESMFDSVLFARDKWLAPGGLMFPDKAHMLVAPVSNQFSSSKLKFWESVYSYRMTALQPLVHGNDDEPDVCVVDPATVCGPPAPLVSFDLQTISKSDLSFTSTFHAPVDRAEFVGGIVAWFDIEFSFCHKPVTFSTGPKAPYTHWKQTQFILWPGAGVPVSENGGVDGTIICAPLESDPRHLGITIQCACKGAHVGAGDTHVVKRFAME